MKEKFDRDLKKDKIEYGYDVEFEVESYLRYQADNFSDKFDAHTYLLMTKALDYFDPAKYFEGDLVSTLNKTKSDFLIISFSSDWRFSPNRSKEIVNSLVAARKNVSYVNIESYQGHDGFLFPDERYVETIKTFLSSDV
jgi:homoserine O-acetyltransferase